MKTKFKKAWCLNCGQRIEYHPLLSEPWIHCESGRAHCLDRIAVPAPSKKRLKLPSPKPLKIGDKIVIDGKPYVVKDVFATVYSYKLT
jgi:hypothetical protein